MRFIPILFLALLLPTSISLGQRTLLSLKASPSEIGLFRDFGGEFRLAMERMEVSGNQSRTDTFAHARLNVLSCWPGTAKAIDDDALVATELQQNWSGNDWTDNNRRLYTYAIDFDESIYQSWRVGDWNYYYREQYAYDGGLLTEYMLQEWTGSAWENYYRERYNREDDLTAEVVGQTWTGTDWENYSRRVCTTDGGLPTEYLYQDWSGSEWENDARLVQAYEGDLLRESRWEDWTRSGWKNYSRQRYDYEGILLTEYVHQERRGSDWEDYFRESYAYENALLTESVRENWLGSEWANGWRVLYSYEGELRGDIVHQQWTGNEWANNSRYVFTYIQSTSSVKVPPLESDAPSVYPNPVRGTATVIFSLAGPGAVGSDLFDTGGRRVASLPARSFGAGQHMMKWDLSTLRAGVYFLRLQGAASGTIKLVVVH